MNAYLQPSPVRWVLDNTTDFCKTNQDQLRPLDYELAVRIRLMGAAAIGLTQAIHCFALWVILSAVSLLTLGWLTPVERLTHRLGSLSGAGLVGVAIAVPGIFYGGKLVEVVTEKIQARADREFRALGVRFVKDFDKEAEQLRKERHAAALWHHEIERHEFFNHALKTMRAERQRVRRECTKAFPKGAKEKYDALADARARMFALLIDQRTALKQLPYTQRQVDRSFVDRTLVMADKVLEELYLYPKLVWAQRIEKWADKWDREAFAEQCLKLFKKNGIDKEVESLVNHVLEADGKEKAFHRFEKDVHAFERRIKGQVDNIEYPNAIVRIWWRIEPWVKSK